VRRRVPQSVAAGGVLEGAPMALATRGFLQPQNRFLVLGPASKHGNAAGLLTYEQRFAVVKSTANAEIVPGEYVDDLAVLGGTTP
jgi:hypothetical protein